MAHSATQEAAWMEKMEARMTGLENLYLTSHLSLSGSL